MNTQNVSTIKELTSAEIDAVTGAGILTEVLGTVGSLIGAQKPLTQIGTSLNEAVGGLVDNLGLGFLLGGVVDVLI